jgi:predicted acyltransferase
VSSRLLSIDAYRGLVMLLLVPDGRGAFSFYLMSKRFPESRVWSALTAQFGHAQWSGATIWDFIMPSFVFLIGVAMPFSYAARVRRGETAAQIAGHAALRVMTLLLLGLILMIPIRSNVDFIWPFLLLAPGLPLATWAQRAFGLRNEQLANRLHIALWVIVLAATVARLAVSIERLGNYDLASLLPQVAFAYALIFWLVNRSTRTQAVALAAILFGYWLAFLLYPLPPADIDLSRLGVSPDHELFTGMFAHWNMNTNLAADFDVWFLNALPRAQQFVFNDHGYQTLNFIPTAAMMLIGVMVGRFLQGQRAPARTRNAIAGWGAAALVAGLLVGLTLCPIVKSIWTPSWTLFSGGIVLLIFAAAWHWCEVRGARRSVWPLVVAGSNSILLYVLASNYKWWFLNRWKNVFGAQVFTGSYEPLLESVAFLISLWVLAAVLHRLRIFVKI